MDHTRFNPLDAQRFDPLRRTRTRLVSIFNTSASKLITGQGPCVRTERARDLWLDHNAVDPFDEGEGSDLEESCSSPSCTSTSIVDTRANSPIPVDVYGHDDIITRTIIRPNRNFHRGPAHTPSRIQMVLTRMSSRWPSATSTYFPSQSSLSVRPRSSPPSRSMSLVLRALNSFSTSSAFGSDVDDVEMHRRKRPVLLVIVEETKERYEDDRAFKEIVASVCPTAGVRGGA
ncbi:hypothetical protein EDD22DRAFT_184067 [Suillus occidentalis]|nr:hypothetical protein EDD22DRAFT_184067 [Suillus occidentalis]